MGFGALRLLALDVAMSFQGVDATVTVPNGDPVETRAIWTQPVSELMPVGHDFQRREPRRVLALARSAVPQLPRGTLIVAAEYEGATPRSWKVDAIERMDADQVRAIVLAVTES